MGTRSRGRGTVAAIGFLLLLAGLLGAGLLYFMSLQRPDDAIESFARAGAGCTTTLDFSETGTFYVYKETGTATGTATGLDSDDCTPTPTVGQAFVFTVTGPAPSDAEIATNPDATITYELDGTSGVSISRLEIDEPGTYEIAVLDEDVSTVVAVGRDPVSGVDDLQRLAILVGAAGVLLGLMFLLLAGRRSKKAATPSIPDGPGWGTRPPADGPNAWQPGDDTPRVPITPAPDQPVSPTPPPPPLPARAPGAGLTPPSWSPPSPDVQPVSLEAPTPVAPVRAPTPIPVLPDTPGAASGQWPSTPTPVPPPPPPPPPPQR